MVAKEQALITRVLDLLAQRFDKRAILRGGMVLRILGSPRFTNDLDYIFVPYKSKKDIVSELIECLESINGAIVTHALNSKCLRAVLTVDNATLPYTEANALGISARTSFPIHKQICATVSNN